MAESAPFVRFKNSPPGKRPPPQGWVDVFYNGAAFILQHANGSLQQVSRVEVIDDLTTGGVTEALSAQQGVTLLALLGDKADASHTHDFADLTGSLPSHTHDFADLTGSLPSHTHVSADITDGSTGGNGASDFGKVAVFRTNGGLQGSAASGNAINGTATAYGAVALRGYATGTGSIVLSLENNSDTFMSIGQDKSVTMDDAFRENFLAALGINSYDGVLDANADLSNGDLYYDRGTETFRMALL